MPDAITKVTLDNGLLVQLKEIHTAPIISHWVWYRVGSRNEEPGKTGLSHWVEHMQFKGTPKYPSGILDKSISRDGGVWNAFTYLDWTTYFETVPADKFELPISLEADRMVNSAFDTEEVEAERTVIISELEGAENEPVIRLGRATQEQCFDFHPYRNQIIGSMDDLQKITREDLYNHYRSHYLPNNAVLAMAGDFETDEIIKKITEAYEHLPAGSTTPQPHVSEEPLHEERRVLLEGPGETAFLKIQYRAPAAIEADFFAYTVLDSLLTGPAGLNMFGGGLSNKTSRLYHALVENERAVSVRGGLQATIDPFTHEIALTVHPRSTPEDLLAAVDDELKRIQDEQVSEEEIARAAKQARALFTYGSENITNQAFWLGFSEMFASYEWFNNYVTRLAQVTPDDVQRVAQEYLSPSRRVVGMYKPTNGKTGSG